MEYRFKKFKNGALVADMHVAHSDEEAKQYYRRLRQEGYAVIPYDQKWGRVLAR
jgi:hypothetical protein